MMVKDNTPLSHVPNANASGARSLAQMDKCHRMFMQI